MRGDNAWDMEPASAKTMRVTGADTNLSTCGGGRGDSTLPKLAPDLRVCLVALCGVSGRAYIPKLGVFRNIAPTSANHLPHYYSTSYALAAEC